MKLRINEDLLGLASVQVTNVGVMTPGEALRLARERGLDLIEVDPKADPPRCRLLAVPTTDAGRELLLLARGALRVFLVRTKFKIHGRPGSFLVGDILTGDAIRKGMLAHIPGGPDVIHAVPIRAVEFVDHVADETSELGLQVVGETPEQVAAIDALEGAQLVDVTEGSG